MTDIIAVLPWAALMLVFAGQLLLNLRLVAAVSSALQDVSRMLGGGAVKATAPVALLPAAPVTPPSDAPHGAAATPTAPKVAPSIVLDPALIAFVKKEEGFRSHAYGDFKQLSIGYGTKASSADEVITEPEALARLMTELAQAQESVEAFAPEAPLGVKQALTDLTYNAGTAWQKQGLGTAIKNKDYSDAKARILQYNHAGGEVDAGLTDRRKSEASWFDNPL